jgi:hypothetical protein
MRFRRPQTSHEIQEAPDDGEDAGGAGAEAASRSAAYVAGSGGAFAASAGASSSALEQGGHGAPADNGSLADMPRHITSGDS